MSKRIGFVLPIVLLVTLLAPLGALASKPGENCPAAASGYEQVDADEWWARTIIGFADGGFTLEEAAELFGFATVAELEAFVREGVDEFDKNGNGLVCMGDVPNTPGLPAYLFRIVDDNSSTKN